MSVRRSRLNFGSCLAALAATLVILGFAGWGLWTLAEEFVSPGLTRAWAFVATALIPPVAGAAYWLGQAEARGKIAGVDLGVERVTRAAGTTVDLRTSATRQYREAAKPEPPPVVLPDPQFSVRQIVDGEVVEL